MNKEIIKAPDYIKEWEEYFNNNKNSILELISNVSELTITIESSPIKDTIEYNKDNSYIPENLIKIENNKITTKYISKEFIEFIVNNLSENIEILNVPGEFIHYSEVLGMYPKLSTFKITNYYEITETDIEDVKKNTNIHNIESFNLKQLTTEFNMNALYYDGITQEIRLFNYDLNIKNPNNRHNLQCHNFIVPNIYENFDDIIKYMKENNINPKDLKYFNAISTTKNEDYISYNNEKEEIEYFGDLARLKEMIGKMIEIECFPEQLFLVLENKDYDYRYLKGINFPVQIDYGNKYTASIEEFITMRETINYYKDLITSANLSPLEQITFAYDIVKSYDYKEAYRPEDSRCLHKIVNSGNIVCVGYALFLKQVLSELGFRIEDYSVNAPNERGYYSNNPSNHRRNIIRIDDDKYNVHMVAALDPTWDSGYDESSKNRFKDEGSSILADVSNLLSYIYFLIPKNEYQFVFKDKETPTFFSYPTDFIAKNFDLLPKLVIRNEDFDDAMYYYQKLFDKEEASLISSYVNAKRPTYKTFKEVIKKVKEAEGYGKEVDKVVNSFEYEDSKKIKTR